MALSASDSSPLSRHVESLYPLARLLTGAEAADTLVERVYERAAEVPPLQRPADEQAWLFRLLIEVRAEERTSDRTAPSADDADPSFSDDSFRRSVATQTAERMLPVAFAACSVQERFVLAVDAVADPADQVLAAALDTTADRARSLRDNARSALRASLRDVLTGPERMLVDVALPDEALRELLEDLVAERFQPPPPALDARISEILDAAASRRTEAEAEQAPESGTVVSLLRTAWTTLQSLLTTRTALVVVLVLVFVGGGLAGLSYFSSPGAPAAQNVVELSVRRASGLETALRTESASEAAAFIRRTWNRHLSVPSLDGATLRGVGRLSVGDGGEVPVLLYGDDETGAQIAAYAYNYALVDRLGPRARLSRELRTELANNDAPLTRRRSDRAVVLWRHQDEIFVMVAPDTDAEALRSRLRL